MTFQTKKNEYGTRVIQAVAIYPNACKYSVSTALAKSEINTPALTDVQTGNITVSGGDPVFFTNSNPYLKIDDEFIKVTVVNATTLNIVSRGELGTDAASHLATTAKIMHSGQADGSCRGYPQLPDGSGCSTGDSFDKDVTREFLFTNSRLTDGSIYFNGLTDINHNPVELKPGIALAKNASVSVSISDNMDGDVYAVPYQEVRSEQSTLFRKLLARHPYFQNRKMITYTGFLEGQSFDPENCIARQYIIDDVSYSNEKVTIRGLDPLMLAEESKAKAPLVSAGVLAVAINNASTQIQLKNFIDGEYGANTDPVTVDIEGELIDCTVNNSATGLLDIVTRGVAGSEVKDHAINASVQLTLVLEDFNPIQAIVDFLQVYTNIDAGFFGDYSTQIATVQSTSGKSYINKPTSVKKIIDEIIRTWAENNISMYFDEVNQEIAIKVLGDFQQQPISLNDFDHLSNIKINPNYKDQITRASIGFAPFNAAKKVDDENASVFYQSINLNTELTGTLEPKEDKEFYSRFLTVSDTDVQIAVGGVGRLANINTRPPTIYEFDIDYSLFGDFEGGVIEEGEIINITSYESVDVDGNPKSENVQILSMKDNPKEAKYRVKAKSFQDIVNEADFDFIIDEDKENYVLSDEFAPVDAGQYTVFITSGTTIGATNTSSYAFNTGTQAAGVTLKIINRGSILGAGGKGANAGYALAANPNDTPQRIVVDGSDGFDGGDALNLTVDTEIDVSQGVIYAGGGGAPSTQSIADSIAFPNFVLGGDGGNGGQGYIGGKGGVAGTAEVELTTFFDSGAPGQDGTRAGPGSFSPIDAGTWGEDSSTSAVSGGAGLGGFAIRSNGNTITITGDNAATIKGKRDF